MLDFGLRVHLHRVNVCLNSISVCVLICICQDVVYVHVDLSYNQTWLNLLYFYCFELCIHVTTILAFMFKLPLKLQPPKNFKYKYLFGDKIPKRMVLLVARFVMMLFFMFFLLKELVMEPHCEVVDLVLAQEKIALTKKRKKAYEMNKHFQDIWVIKFP